MQLKLLPSPVMQVLLTETFPGHEQGFASRAGAAGMHLGWDNPGSQGKGHYMFGLGMMFSIAFG